MHKFKDILNELEIKPQLDKNAFYKKCQEVIEKWGGVALEYLIEQQYNEYEDFTEDFNIESPLIKPYFDYFNSFDKNQISKLIKIVRVGNDMDGSFDLNIFYKKGEIMYIDRDDYLIIFHNGSISW